MLVLYIMRHGEAEPKRLSVDDEERKLTQAGIEQVKSSLKSIKSLGAKVDLIVSSPFQRAVETAKICENALSPPTGQIVIEKTLEPDRSPYELYALVRKLQTDKVQRLFIVSHQPLVSNLVSDLLGIGPERVAMNTASIARVDFQTEEQWPEGGTLVWLISPYRGNK